MPAINCIQHNAQKQIITEKNIVESNLKGFGNSVGSITNRATAMFSVQARFDKHSKEYKELEYRIICTQKHQQDSIDSIKGIQFTPMPKYWYDTKSCQSDYQKSICCEKKPYFMIYRYENERKKYKDFLKEQNSHCLKLYGIEIDDLLNIPQNQLTEQQRETIKWYYILNPVDMGDCTINKICHYIEQTIGEYKSSLKERNFDYKKFLVKRRCTQQHKDGLIQLMNFYMAQLKNYKSLDESEMYLLSTTTIEDYFKEKAQEICPNADERRNILLELCYGDNQIKSNKEFCWLIIIDSMIGETENE